MDIYPNTGLVLFITKGEKGARWYIHRLSCLAHLNFAINKKLQFTLYDQKGFFVLAVSLTEKTRAFALVLIN